MNTDSLPPDCPRCSDGRPRPSARHHGPSVGWPRTARDADAPGPPTRPILARWRGGLVRVLAPSRLISPSHPERSEGPQHRRYHSCRTKLLGHGCCSGHALVRVPAQL